MKVAYGLITAIIVLSASGYGQPDLPPVIRSAVYRIEQPGVKQGTALLVAHLEHSFIITNAHVVQDSSKRICDSIFLYLNEIQSNNEVLSLTEKRTVFLRRDGKEYFVECVDKDLDLVCISLAIENSDIKPKGRELYKLKSSTIPDSADLLKILKAGEVITFIGYPSKRVFPKALTATPEYRWGYCLKYDSVYITTNAPVIKGSSGSPGFMAVEGKYYFVGIAARLVNQTSQAIAASAIKSCYDRLFRYLDGEPD